MEGEGRVMQGGEEGGGWEGRREKWKKGGEDEWEGGTISDIKFTKSFFRAAVW